MRFQLVGKRPWVAAYSPGQLKKSPDGHLFIRYPDTRIIRIGDEEISLREGASDEFTPLGRSDILVVEGNRRVATLWRERELVRHVLETERIWQLSPFVLSVAILNIIVLSLVIPFVWLPLRVSPAAAVAQPLLDLTFAAWIAALPLIVANAFYRVGCLTGAAARTPTALYLGRRDGVVAVDAKGAIVADCKLDDAVCDILAVSEENGRTRCLAVRTKRALYLLGDGLQILWRRPLAFNAWCPQTFLSRPRSGNQLEPCLVLCDGHAIHWISLEGRQRTRLQLPSHRPTSPTFGIAGFRGDGTDQVAVCLGRGLLHPPPLRLYHEGKLIAQTERLPWAYGVPQIGVADVNGDGRPEVVFLHGGWMHLFAVT